MATNLAQELFPFAEEFLLDGRSSLVIDGLDWAPEEWQLLTDEKISTAAVDLSKSVAEELESFRYDTLDKVLQEPPECLASLSAITLLVLGTARTTRSGIVDANTRWR